MGGIRGVKHYMQRVAVQASPTTMTAITGVYQQYGQQTASTVHPFRKYFEELRIGDTVTTHKRTVTEADIVLMLVNHRQYYELPAALLDGKVVIDTRGVWT